MSDTLQQLLALPPYSLATEQRDAALCTGLSELTTAHRERCPEYARIVSALFPKKEQIPQLSDVPYVPVSLFKRLELASVPPSEIFKVLRSSGTTTSTPSRIVLDRDTARAQALALKHIMTSILGVKRVPMLIVDSEAVASSSGEHSARAAGVIGMMNFGREHIFALDSQEILREDAVVTWLNTYHDQPIFIFGFTAIVWHRFLNCLSNSSLKPRSAPCILVHGGGWKKLVQSAVSREQFVSRAQQLLGDAHVLDYYGMVEQVGSIYLECSHGFLHTPNFATVITRDFRTHEELPPHQEGLIQVLSLLPTSYPGHSILTEDIGVIQGRDNCACGWRGTYFSVKGRLSRAELRGCSDTANVG
jgi:hypothetical protein